MDKFLIYISGIVYVIIGDIIILLYNLIFYVFLLFIEDVYLNGICCERIGVEVIYFLGFDIVRSRGKVNG